MCLIGRMCSFWGLTGLEDYRSDCNSLSQVLPIFQQAGIKCIVTVTSRKNHAYDAITGSTTEALMKFDGIIAIGGDGFFQEIANGLLDLGRKPGNNQTSLLQKIRVGKITSTS